MRSKRTITLLSILLVLVVTFFVPRPVAAQPSVLVQKLWGGSYFDSANAVATDRTGNIYVAGATASYGPGSPSCTTLSILKYSAQGNLLWQRLWSNGSVATAFAIATDTSGNVYVAGKIYNTCTLPWAGFLLKLDSGGNLVWQKTLAMPGNSEFDALAIGASGNVFVAGFYDHGTAASIDALVLRFDPAGNLVWQRAWGGTGYDQGVGIALDPSDNVYVVGSTYSFGPSGNNFFLLKIDSSGNLQFQKIVGNGVQSGRGVGVDSTGNIYAVGTGNNGTYYKMLLLKFDPTGGPIWQKTWGGTRNDFPIGLALDSSGDLEIVGSTNSYGPGGTCGSSVCLSMLMLKLDGSGNILTQLVYGSGNANDQAAGVADLLGTMVAVGSVNAGPPYQTGSGNNTLGAASVSISSQGNNTLAVPTASIRNTNGGALITSSGSQTYSGGSDEIMLRFGDRPTLSFNTSPATGGTITFNGTTYSNGQSASLPIGNATATANTPSGYMFAGWNATGGVSVSNPTASTTQVAVAGSGTLTAQFQQTSSAPDYTLYYVSGALAGAAAIALLGVLMFRRKKKSGIANPGQTV